jgi:hypothetical protein
VVLFSGWLDGARRHKVIRRREINRKSRRKVRNRFVVVEIVKIVEEMELADQLLRFQIDDRKAFNRMTGQKSRKICKTRNLFRILFTFKMFRLFNDPFFYRPSYTYAYHPSNIYNTCKVYSPYRYARTEDLFDRYLDAFEERLFSGLNREEQSGCVDSEEGARQPQSQIQSQPQRQRQPEEAPKVESANSIPAPLKADAGPSQPRQQREEQRVGQGREPEYAKSFVYQTRSTFDGENYVEEHRERVTGTDGENRTVVRRRLGDRWYENEIHTDKEGKRTERETWHNIADDEIDNFKQEWTQQRPVKTALESEPSAQPQLKPQTAVEASPEPEKPSSE